MHVKINKPITIHGGEKTALEQTVIDIPDDQLLKLGKKYFELASNPANYSIAADNIVTGCRAVDTKVPDKDFFDVLRDKYHVCHIISLLRDVKEVKTFADDPVQEKLIYDFIHDMYELAVQNKPR